MLNRRAFVENKHEIRREGRQALRVYGAHDFGRHAGVV
jgi:hypothetical protein